MKDIFITNLEGNPIEVTDLDEAIKQAEGCMKMKHEDQSMKALDDKLFKYWSHIHTELLKLKK